VNKQDGGGKKHAPASKTATKKKTAR